MALTRDSYGCPDLGISSRQRLQGKKPERSNALKIGRPEFRSVRWGGLSILLTYLGDFYATDILALSAFFPVRAGAPVYSKNLIFDAKYGVY